MQWLQDGVLVAFNLDMVDNHLLFVVAVVLNREGRIRIALLNEARQWLGQIGIHHVEPFAIRNGKDVEILHEPQLSHAIGQVFLVVLADIETE